MAGKGGMKPIASRAATRGLGQKDTQRRTNKRRRANSVLMAEALDIAATYDIPVVRGNAVVDVLQMLLDRLMDHWRMTCMEVDKLSREEWVVERFDENGNRLVEPHMWIQYEQNLRYELTDLSIRMGHLGVDERKLRLEEAKTELLGRALMLACGDIGLDIDVQQKLGAALRARIAEVEGAQDPQTGNRQANDRQPVIEATARDAA